MKVKILYLLFALFMMLSISCSNNSNNDANVKTSDQSGLVIYTPHPEKLISSIVNGFEAQNPDIKVEVITAVTGELIKRIEVEKDNPVADILWGPSLNGVRYKSDLFEPYVSTNNDNMMEGLKNDEGSISRFSQVPSVLIVNTNLIGNIKIEGYGDLLNPELKGKIIFADPSASSSAFEHLVNMLYDMGNGDPEKGWDYVNKLCANLDGKLASGSSGVYKGVADGEYAVGLTYEEAGLTYMEAGSPVKVVYMKEGVRSTPDVVCIVKNAKNMDNAKKFVDYSLSLEAQNMLINNLNRRPSRADSDKSQKMIPMEEINIIKEDPDLVEANTKQWLDKFKELFTSY